LRLHRRRVRLALDLGKEEVGIGAGAFSRMGVSVEAAEQAVIGAEGHVHIGEARRIQAGGPVVAHQARPCRLDLLGRQRPSRAPRHHAAPRGERVANRIAAQTGEMRLKVFRRHRLPLDTPAPPPGDPRPARADTTLPATARTSTRPAARLIKTLRQAVSSRYVK